MKIIKNQRPAFDKEKVKFLLKTWYDINTEIDELPSERDQNFHLMHHDYILKISNKKEDKKFLDFQNRVIQKIENINHIKIHPNKNGEIMFEVDNHLIRMLDYLPGKVLAKSTHTDELLLNLGQLLAEIDVKLLDFTHPAMKREFQWDLMQAESVIENNLQFVKDRNIIKYFLDQFKKIDLSIFRRSVIHNDANDYNVIVKNNKITIIDFGDMIYTATIFELAIAIAYVILDKDDPIYSAIQIIKGYQSILPLTEYEIDNLFILVAMRLCLSVSISAFQIQQEPNNKYLIISEKPAWETLYKLKEINIQLVRYIFRDAIDMLPESEFQMDFDTADIVRGEYKIIDLSIGSTELGLINNNFSDIGISNLIKDKILVGRYGETRLQYINDSFRIKVNDGYNWLTTHMGIDLFYNPGTPIFAPLDGIIHSFSNNSDKFGPTLILEHIFENRKFYTLYGHLDSIDNFDIGKSIKKGEKIAEIGSYDINGKCTPHLHFQLILDLLGYEGTFPGVVEHRYRRIWKKICPDPNIILKINNINNINNINISKEQGIDEILEFRNNHLGKSLSVSYNKPLKIVRGYMQYLYDHTGRQYLDAVNNIAHVGHQHPYVIKNLIKQAQVLNTNTRYLHENIIKYTSKLLKTVPKPLEVCFFVNSGSEANELAIRLARTYTKRDDIIVLDCAYHGNTNLLIDISPYKYSGPGGVGRKDFVHPVKTPDLFRGEFRGEDAGKLYAEEIVKVVENNDIAAFICESLPGVGGQIILPDDYLKNAYVYVRKAGGVCIADEVQVGFGRIGKYFWGFEQQGVIPDIVVIGKPIGNGHPLAAVITTKEIADAFDNGMEYFNSFGGNPVSCAVGLAVLEVIENENLQAHALKVGTYLLNRLKKIGEKYDLIGDVRGMGLYIGLELILDDQLTPAADEASYITNRMRDHGILISTDGPLHNVLKIKPPMQFTIDNADFLVDSLDKIMRED